MAPSSARSSSSGCRSPSARSGRAGRFCSVWPSSSWCCFFAAESSKHGPDTGRGVMPLVRTERLTKSFGALVAVNAVTFAVDEGSLHSVIGPNGAGKTTLFNLLSGQLAPTSGRMVTLVSKLKGRYTVILIEHKIDVVMSMSDRISVMHFGSLIAEGAPAEIQRSAEVRRAYLGGFAAP